MTVIKLASGELAIWSPVSLNATEMQRLEALGPISFLIVPNAGHRLDLKAWKDRYPEARVVAPPLTRGPTNGALTEGKTATSARRQRQADQLARGRGSPLGSWATSALLYQIVQSKLTIT